MDPRACSLSDAERCLGISRQTLARRIRDEGAPCVRGSGGKGDPWVVSVPDLHAWHVERARGEAAADATLALGAVVGIEDDELKGMTSEEAKRRRLIFDSEKSRLDAAMKKIALDRDSGALIERALVTDVLRGQLVVFRSEASDMAPGLADKVRLETDIKVITKLINDRVRAMLEKVTADADFEVDKDVG